MLVFPSGQQRRFTIGRDVDCDMVLPDPTVSRWHAGLKREASGWMLDDLGSTNGTRLNGWRVRAAVPVRVGDLVSFGAATFVMAGPGSGPGLSAAGSWTSG
jgi:pSer/pThr/pTyr-binding forkhead associated (FHA) protein